MKVIKTIILWICACCQSLFWVHCVLVLVCVENTVVWRYPPPLALTVFLLPLLHISLRPYGKGLIKTSHLWLSAPEKNSRLKSEVDTSLIYSQEAIYNWYLLAQGKSVLECPWVCHPHSRVGPMPRTSSLTQNRLHLCVCVCTFILGVFVLLLFIGLYLLLLTYGILFEGRETERVGETGRERERDRERQRQRQRKRKRKRKRKREREREREREGERERERMKTWKWSLVDGGSECVVNWRRGRNMVQIYSMLIFKQTQIFSRVCWHTPLIPACGRQRQVDLWVKTSLVYMVSFKKTSFRQTQSKTSNVPSKKSMKTTRTTTTTQPSPPKQNNNN